MATVSIAIGIRAAVVLGRTWLHRTMVVDIEDAIAIDPDFSRAYAALAMANTDAYRHDWSDDPALTARIALQQARHALALSPHSPNACLAMGYAQFFVAGDHQAAIDMAERTPNARTSYLAAATTPRLLPPPTTTGLPRSSALSRCSIDA